MATERGTRSAKTPRKMRVARGGRKVVGAQNDRGRDAGISNDLELWLDVLKDRKRNLVYRAVNYWPSRAVRGDDRLPVALTTNMDDNAAGRMGGGIGGRLYFVSFFVTPHHLPPVQRPFLCAIPGLAHSSSGYLATNYLDTFSKRRALPNVCRASSLPSRGSLPTNAVFHGRPRKTSATSESEHQDRWPTRLNCNFAQALRKSLASIKNDDRRTSKAQLQPLRAKTRNTSVDSSSTELEVEDCSRRIPDAPGTPPSTLHTVRVPTILNTIYRLPATGALHKVPSPDTMYGHPRLALNFSSRFAGSRKSTLTVKLQKSFSLRTAITRRYDDSSFREFNLERNSTDRQPFHTLRPPALKWDLHR
ncbi:hypothetical protein B0H14DRAFT_2582868 [Mycena olivaceomarginata]|nr:hypothetical protein B0H14DRAFT_2582868 [Mycena olivaceomarginata]